MTLNIQLNMFIPHTSLYLQPPTPFFWSLTVPWDRAPHISVGSLQLSKYCTISDPGSVLRQQMVIKILPHFDSHHNLYLLHYNFCLTYLFIYLLTYLKLHLSPLTSFVFAAFPAPNHKPNFPVLRLLLHLIFSSFLVWGCSGERTQ